MHLFVTFVSIIILAIVIIWSATTSTGNSTMESEIYDFEHRSVALAIFLSIITAGIYYFYWFVRIIKQAREFHGNYMSCAGEVCLNLFIPFYSYYWFYTRNYQLAVDAYERGESMKNNSISCMVFAILGMPFISLAIMQRNINRYIEMKQFKHASQNVITKGNMQGSAKEKLSELQDLLVSNLITQEDYDEKKKEILLNMEKADFVVEHPNVMPPIRKSPAPAIIVIMIIVIGSIGTLKYYYNAEKQKQLAIQKQLEQEYEQAKEEAFLDQIGEINEKHLQDSIEGKQSKPQYDNLDIFQGDDSTSSDSSYSQNTTSSESNLSDDSDGSEYDDSSYEDSPEPFYGIWCDAYKKKSEAKTALKTWENRGIEANIYITTQWSNLNTEKWYVISTGEFASKSDAKKALTKTQKYCKSAYIKYTGDYKG